MLEGFIVTCDKAKMESICICVYIYIHIHIQRDIIEGSLEVKLPTIWTVEKQR